MNYGSTNKDPETKVQLFQWKSPGSPHLKKVQQSGSKIQTMLPVSFDWEGVIPHEHTPPGQTITKQYYLNVLHWLVDAIWGNQLQLW